MFVERATTHKEQGNEQYKKGLKAAGQGKAQKVFFHEAIKCYTEGLKEVPTEVLGVHAEDASTCQLQLAPYLLTSLTPRWPDAGQQGHEAARGVAHQSRCGEPAAQELRACEGGLRRGSQAR